MKLTRTRTWLIHMLMVGPREGFWHCAAHRGHNVTVRSNCECQTVSSAPDADQHVQDRYGADRMEADLAAVELGHDHGDMTYPSVAAADYRRRTEAGTFEPDEPHPWPTWCERNGIDPDSGLPVDPSDDPVWRAGYDAATSDHLDAREAEEAATDAYILVKGPEIAEAQALSPHQVDLEHLRSALVNVRYAFEGLQEAGQSGDEAAVALWDNHIDFASLILAMMVGKYLEARI